MLTVRFESGEQCKRAYEALGEEGEPCGANFVMYDDGAFAALMRAHFEGEDGRTLFIDSLRFRDGLEDGDKKFFLHAMFFKFREGAGVKIATRIDDRDIISALVPFGFKDAGGVYEINSGDINLYYNCGGRQNG